MHPWQLVLAAGAMGLGAFVQGGVGFGASLVAAPLLALIDVRFVPGPISVASLLLNVAMISAGSPGEADRGIRWAVVGSVPGTVVAGLALAALSADGLSITFAALTLLGVAITASGWDLSPTKGSLLGAGVLSGFTGTISSIGGPPVALVYHRASGARLRATMPRYFLITGLIAAVAQVAAGKLGGRELLWGLAMVPGLAVGYLGSGWLARHLDKRTARPVVLGLSALAAVTVLVRELL